MQTVKAMPLDSKHAFGFWSWDSLGIVASLLCLVHCLALPLLALVFPLLFQHSGEHSSLHLLALILIAPLALVAFATGFQHHRRLIVPLFGGLGLVLVSMPFFEAHHILGEAAELVLTLLGSTLLILTHLKNRKLHRCCSFENKA